MSNEDRRSNEEQVRIVLSRFLSDAGAGTEAVDDALVQALASSIERATETATENVEEIVGGDDPHSMSMIYIRHGRRTAKSIHFRNFSADATTAT